MTLSGHWSSVRDLLAQAGAHPQYVDIELTHADCAWGPDRPLPAGWRWAFVTPDLEPAYVSLLNRSMGPMPGVYVPPEAEAIASMRTTADGTRLLLDEKGEARAMIRCKLSKRYLHLISSAPEMRGRGLGRLGAGRDAAHAWTRAAASDRREAERARARFLHAYGLRPDRRGRNLAIADRAMNDWAHAAAALIGREELKRLSERRMRRVCCISAMHAALLIATGA